MHTPTPRGIGRMVSLCGSSQAESGTVQLLFIFGLPLVLSIAAKISDDSQKVSSLLGARRGGCMRTNESVQRWQIVAFHRREESRCRVCDRGSREGGPLFAPGIGHGELPLSDGENSSGDLTDGSRFNQAASVTFWSSPAPRWRWYAGYTWNDSALDTVATIPLFDG